MTTGSVKSAGLVVNIAIRPSNQHDVTRPLSALEESGSGGSVNVSYSSMPGGGTVTASAHVHMAANMRESKRPSILRMWPGPPVTTVVSILPAGTDYVKIAYLRIKDFMVQRIQVQRGAHRSDQTVSVTPNGIYQVTSNFQTQAAHDTIHKAISSGATDEVRYRLASTQEGGKGQSPWIRTAGNMNNEGISLLGYALGAKQFECAAVVADAMLRFIFNQPREHWVPRSK